ncbi:hypothetical protein PGT21_014027 [Puccinia graminis f. sp. tritici]|uniref:CCHC-type domain-containing protein n=1 Tax=Puccinia graminis f. sp. tritici TaxID=56615 RepID=A0A5B0P354_PUCGR|nr:hypothetical protein PGTUg99_006902 [Puccinia graminis f. sp. tritici]KAA1099596.1 hypothetical protein PGT21_014027 [Puccinia graminis f. sp. tritici]
MVKIKSPNKQLCFDGTKVKRFLETYEIVAGLEKATELDMAKQIRLFVLSDKLLDVLETLDGFSPPDWPKLKAAMITYWGQVDTAKFTTRDLDKLVEEWSSKEGVSSAANYQSFRKVWEPIQSYLLAKAHIDSVEEIQNSYYQAFSAAVQNEIRKKLMRDGTMVTTLDKRFKLPTFKILQEGVDSVMKEQTVLTFEDSRTSEVVPSPSFSDRNRVMKKMEDDCRPKEGLQPSNPAPLMDELSKMFEAFEQRIDQKLAAVSSKAPQGSRQPMVCFYCHREGHRTARCQELQKDKEDNLVEQKGTNFFLPNGALIPWDSSRPIRHVVASFQPSRATSSQAALDASPSFKVGCGLLQLWYPPAVSLQTFAGAYESDPAVWKRHEASKPYKAPATPPASARRVPKKALPAPASSKPLSNMEPEMELFDRTESTPNPEASGSQEPNQAAQQSKPSGSQQKVRFERGVSCEHPDAAESVLKKISDLSVPGVTVSELMAISPTVAEGMKKWVSRRRVEIGSEELKVHSGTLVEGKEAADLRINPKLYSCPLGYLSCFIGKYEKLAAPLVDSGSQLNLISDSLAIKFNLSPRVNFTSAVYGINNQACKLMGVAEDVPMRIGKTIIQSFHFWITRNNGPLILGWPFLMDIGETLAYSSQSGEKLIIPDAAGRNIEVSLCSTETGRWERDFPGQGRRAVLTHMGRIPDDSQEDRPFL